MFAFGIWTSGQFSGAGQCDVSRMFTSYPRNFGVTPRAQQLPHTRGFSFCSVRFSRTPPTVLSSNRGVCVSGASAEAACEGGSLANEKGRDYIRQLAARCQVTGGQAPSWGNGGRAVGSSAYPNCTTVGLFSGGRSM